MDRLPIFAPASLLAAAVAWTLTLAFGEPTIGTTAAAVVAVDLLVITLTTIVGLVVARARWARRFAIVVFALMAAMALTMPVSNNWIVAIVLSGLAVAAVTGPSLDDHVRPPAVHGLHPRAVALPLLLLVLPAVTGIATGTPVPVPAWVLIISSPIVAWAYGKAMIVGLWSARGLIPVAAVVTMLSMSWPSALLLGAATLVETWLAWTAEARHAVIGQDRVPASGFVQIPPELAPREVLSAAGLDERGRPRSTEPADNGSSKGDG